MQTSGFKREKQNLIKKLWHRKRKQFDFELINESEIIINEIPYASQLYDHAKKLNIHLIQMVNRERREKYKIKKKTTTTEKSAQFNRSFVCLLTIWFVWFSSNSEWDSFRIWCKAESERWQNLNKSEKTLL